jgi:hypothetical protein
MGITEMIDAQNENVSTSKPSLFLTFEGLKANTNYRLLIYLKKVLINNNNNNNNNFNHRSPLNQVQLIFNQTVTTLAKENKSESKLYDEYYDDEDDDDDEYLDDVSYEDYSTEMTNKKNDRIISCDLYRSQVKTSSSSSSSSSNSLFSLNSSRKKFVNQFLTINYSSNNMNQLILLTLRNSSIVKINEQEQTTLDGISSNFSNFRDFLYLEQFSKNGGMDYAVNYDCLKQYEFNSRQDMILLNRPLCLFNLESEEKKSESEESFSVHTSLKVANSKLNSLKRFNLPLSTNIRSNTFLHVASMCHKKRHTMAKFNSNFKIDTKPTLALKSNNNTFQSLKQLTNKTDNLAAAPMPFIIQATTHTLFTFKRNQQQLDSDAKKFIQSMQILDSLTINDCFIISDQELQFRIDHDVFQKNNITSSKLSSNVNTNRLAHVYNQPIDYEIELVMPNKDLLNDEMVIGRDMKRSKMSQATSRNNNKTHVYNFSFKRQNFTQVSIKVFLDKPIGEIRERIG